MDALPVTERVDVPFKSTVTTEYRGEKVGVMHACGHDGHTAILMGAAQVLAGMKKDLPGTVVFMFQPAEEGAPEGEEGGAPLMLKEGVFRDYKPDAVFGLHLWAGLNAGTIGYRSGSLMAASDTFRLVVKGRQTHGSRPWGGVDPIVASAQILNGMQTHRQPPDGHHALPGGRDRRRDQGRHPLQHHSGLRRDDGHHPDVRRGRARADHRAPEAHGGEHRRPRAARRPSSRSSPAATRW